MRNSSQRTSVRSFFRAMRPSQLSSFVRAYFARIFELMKLSKAQRNAAARELKAWTALKRLELARSVAHQRAELANDIAAKRKELLSGTARKVARQVHRKVPRPSAAPHVAKKAPKRKKARSKKRKR